MRCATESSRAFLCVAYDYLAGLRTTLISSAVASTPFLRPASFLVIPSATTLFMTLAATCHFSPHRLGDFMLETTALQTPPVRSGGSRLQEWSKRTRPILRYDLPASLVVFLVALPLSLGIAVASDAPVLAGLIAAVIGGVVAGALGGSALQVSGPAAGLTVIVAGLVAEFGWAVDVRDHRVRRTPADSVRSDRVARAAFGDIPRRCARRCWPASG